MKKCPNCNGQSRQRDEYALRKPESEPSAKLKNDLNLFENKFDCLECGTFWCEKYSAKSDEIKGWTGICYVVWKIELGKQTEHSIYTNDYYLTEVQAIEAAKLL